jgi:hypothetical protein
VLFLATSGGSRIDTPGGLIKEDVDLQLRFNGDFMLCYSNCYSVLVEISPSRGGGGPPPPPPAPPGSANVSDNGVAVTQQDIRAEWLTDIFAVLSEPQNKEVCH